jgi:tetratricopeptide (TPR) repeat protein
MNNLAYGYFTQGQRDKAVPLFEETVRLREAKMGRRHPDTLQTLGNLGQCYRDAGRLAEAIPLLEEAHRGAKEHAALRAYGLELLRAYVLAGKRAEAIALAEELLASVRQRLPNDGLTFSDHLAALGQAMFDVKAPERAEAYLRDCLAIRAKEQPDGWTTFATRTLLGAALLAQQRYADAEPLLVQGYQGMMQREAQIPAAVRRDRLAKALDWLVQLYTAWGKPGEAAKWKTEPGPTPPAAAKPSP